MKKQYRVTLPIEIIDEKTGKGGGILRAGELVDLDDATAKAYAHALIQVQDEKGGEE